MQNEYKSKFDYNFKLNCLFYSFLPFAIKVKFMIKIDVKRSRDHIAVSCVGHANYNTVGQDIVCAAISSLLQTLCYSLEELTQNNVNVCLKSGNSLIAIYKPTSKSQLLVDSFFIGCREIANVYSDYVEISKN